MFSDRFQETGTSQAAIATAAAPGFVYLPGPAVQACPLLYLQAYENACKEVFAARRARLLEPSLN